MMCQNDILMKVRGKCDAFVDIFTACLCSLIVMFQGYYALGVNKKF